MIDRTVPVSREDYDRMADQCDEFRQLAYRLKARLRSSHDALRTARLAVQRLQTVEQEFAKAKGIEPWTATVAALEEIGLQLELAELDTRTTLDACPKLTG